MIGKQLKDSFRSDFTSMGIESNDRFIRFAAEPAPSGNALLEDGTDILLEDGTNLLLEG